MESSSLPFVKISNTKRFVIQDSITKVTSDGEPHEMMTMIAGLSGLLAAIVILTVLIFLVACKKTKNNHQCDKCSVTSSSCLSVDKRPSTLSDVSVGAQSKCTSLATIYNPKQLQTTSDDGMAAIRCTKGNLHSNLNKAFVESNELNLQCSLDRSKSNKKKKKTHWQNEFEMGMEMEKETYIQIERY